MYLFGHNRRAICAILALLFISIPMSGCLSLVAGREMMEGARGEPMVEETSTDFVLNHDFIVDGTGLPFDQVQHSMTDQILIDRTVSEILIVFKVNFNFDDIIPEEVDFREVDVRLLWCDDDGLNCDESDPIFSQTETDSWEGSIEIKRDETSAFQDGLWRLQVTGTGAGSNTGISGEVQDGWRLTATVFRPCLSFPESPEECTPTIDLA
jgi:hypothetical protein